MKRNGLALILGLLFLNLNTARKRLLTVFPSQKQTTTLANGCFSRRIMTLSKT